MTALPIPLVGEASHIRLRPPEPNGGQSTTLEFVTPAMAVEWLKFNQRNRDLTHSTVEALTRDILGGRWKVTHQGIAFDAHGSLADGQHRLHAIAAAGAGVWMNVTRGLDADAILAVDVGARRTVAEQLTLVGGLGKVTSQMVGTLRQMVVGLGARRRLTVGEERGLMLKHHAAIAFAETEFNGTHRRGVSAPVRAVVARAWYSADPERLRRFGSALTVGMATNEDEAVIVLFARWLAQAGGREQRAKYGKAEAALHAYLNGRKIEKLQATKAELFPLPDEVVAAAAAPSPDPLKPAASPAGKE